MPCPAAVLLRTSPQPALHPCLLRSYTKLYKKHVKIMFPRVSGEGNGCCSEGSSRPCCTCIAVQVQGPMCCVWLFVSLTASSRRARPPGRHRRLPHARPPRNPHRRQRELTAACLVYGSLAVQLVRPDCRPPAPPFGAAPPVSTCLLMLPAAALPTHPPAAVGHGPHPLPAVQRRHARPRDWQQRRRAAPRCDGVSLFDLTKRVAVLPARAPSLKRRNSKQLLPSVGCHAANNTGEPVALCFSSILSSVPGRPRVLVRCTAQVLLSAHACFTSRVVLRCRWKYMGARRPHRFETRATKSQPRSHALLPIAPGAAACRQRRRPAILHLHPTLTASPSVWFFLR